MKVDYPAGAMAAIVGVVVIVVSRFDVTLQSLAGRGGVELQVLTRRPGPGQALEQQPDTVTAVSPSAWKVDGRRLVRGAAVSLERRRPLARSRTVERD